MRISRVEATTHSVPVEVPMLAHEIIRPVVFVTVETDSGVTGYGLTGHAQRFGVAEFINREAGPYLVGRDPTETERLWQELYSRFNPRSQTGVWSSAVSALDIALWDIKGKHYGEPVWRLLGGARNPVPCYITFGLLEFNLPQLLEMAEYFADQGENRLKMVVAIDGGERPMEDAARVGAVRDILGENVELMVDANYGFSFNRALELCKLIEPYRITWFEEPVYQNDARLLAELRRRTSIPISAGQNEGHRFRHRDLIVNGAVDIVQPNVCYVGGYTEGVKVAHMAQAFNLPIANGGGWPHHNAHLQAAMSNGWRVEFHYLMWQVGETIYRDPPGPKRGWVTLTEEPGLGLDPNGDALREYRDR
ncbi:MAG: mandelate racemase/muconate lactonizing enzyme family protein [Dehalococcoidia bacterium]|nr:mandelate racemase/muconate lactonizing enzyme family protein [Dehalococcoidia bacterium]